MARTSRATKRKPLKDVSNNGMITPKPTRKKSARNKSKKIGDAEDTYIQIKGSKGGVYLATVDPETGGIQVTIATKLNLL